jgi:uncharacterized membrane protein YidH (DUF202 family)
MFELFFKIWWMIAILPVLILLKGYDMFKKFMKKRGYPMDWVYVAYFLLAVLVILLILLLANGYPL